jgi:cytochrome c oxidase cbb3-type subunit 3
MPDFTSSFWSWFIGLVTVISIVALVVFALQFSGRKKRPGDKVESVGHVWDGDLHELNNPLPRWWLYLYLLTIAWGLIYLFLYPGLGAYGGYRSWTQLSQYQEEIDQAERQYGPIFARYLNQDLNSLVTDPEALAIGARLFSTYCTTCHGSDAGGARGIPDLTDKDWLFGGDPQTIKTSIMEGRTGIMVPWQDSLGTDGVFNVAEYVRSLSGQRADATVAARGKQIFEVNCIACHGADGKGNQLLGGPNLTDDIWLWGGTQAAILETVTRGRNGQMPPHKEFLGEAKAHLLAAYVYSLSRN